MVRNSTRYFRIAFLSGLIFLFFSLFLEWYSFQIYELNNELLVSWKYDIFFGWFTPFSEISTLNEVRKPESTQMPIILIISLIISLILSGYVVLFKNVENAAQLEGFYKFAYINGFLLILVLFLIIVFPTIYLIPHNLYFPLLNINDYNAGLRFSYIIGPGYILQLLSFPLIFPYSIFYYRTINTFIQQESIPEKRIDVVIRDTQESLDLDELIAREELKLNLDKNRPNHFEDDTKSIVTKFIKGK